MRLFDVRWRCRLCVCNANDDNGKLDDKLRTENGYYSLVEQTSDCFFFLLLLSVVYSCRSNEWKIYVAKWNQAQRRNDTITVAYFSAYHFHWVFVLFRHRFSQLVDFFFVGLRKLGMYILTERHSTPTIFIRISIWSVFSLWTPKTFLNERSLLKSRSIIIRTLFAFKRGCTTNFTSKYFI